MTRSITLAGSGLAAAPFGLRLAGQGYEVFALPAGMAEPPELDLLILLPRDLIECEELLFEKARFARRPDGPEAILICGTLSPRYVRALRARVPKHIRLIDAAVVGSTRQVEGGQGAFLVGASAEDFTLSAPIFGAIGRSVELMGEFGAGTSAKALRDCFAAATSALTRSALDWAGAQGIEEERLVRLLEATFDGDGTARTPDPAAHVTNTLPGDEAGIALVRNVENAIDIALKGVHLTPPRNMARGFSSVRHRQLH